MVDNTQVHIHGELEDKPDDELPTSSSAVFDYYDRADVKTIIWENEDE